MAVAKHLGYLNQGAEYWNAWRQENLRIRPVLTGVDLVGRDFSGYNFLKANLSGSNLSQARFCGANLRYTDLSGCNLTEADLTGANIMLADMTGANLRGAQGIDDDQIGEALTDDQTTLP